jgi:hypothetical protein
MLRSNYFQMVVIAIDLVLFIYTGIDKIVDHSLFVEQLSLSPLISIAAWPISLLLPALELSIVALLISKRYRLIGLFATIILMSVFTIYVTTLFIINVELPCSCGGIFSYLSWNQHLLVNGALVILNILSLVGLRKKTDCYQNGLRTRL